MTDITELAQSEINDALAQLKQISEYPTPSTQYARVLRKYILALVEALEKAQETIAFQQGEIKALLSSLESRTVTVKLPQAVSAGGQGYQEQVERILTASGIKVEAE
ncbi:hypothetical protein WDU25_12030 [Klebsiella pneumoniae]|uniref:hypothetical protein n=1 Tax=Klebsiella pneumoniae TaxID=573 RepID=UPI00030B0F60|nr:hypothetical protein [Klebsiella pneumoniae]HCU0756294.1 hypothetical protein [Klebsiella quasipneumoniae]HDT2866005.1 hypothetical protein [Klebsiella pneumoniae subsp. pneumoniae]EKW9769319.1 hypothetical protein [Klebsiella pneumoniae]EKZ5975650.1 hypothetical protein [Klebsiella pneumoniae]ELQ0668543.1 hypothetical protein [Klebsiella pneumoniae]